jgi:hypothetical protein
MTNRVGSCKSDGCVIASNWLLHLKLEYKINSKCEIAFIALL